MRIFALILASILLLSCGTRGSTGGVTKTDGALTVRLIEPQDGATVATSVVQVKGEAPPDTVVTVNDDILVVDSTGSFDAPVTLAEGPNVIEVVASDTDGDEVSFEVAVTFHP